LVTGFSTVPRVSSLTIRKTSSISADRVGGPASQGLGRRVEQGHPPVPVGHHHRVPDARQRGAEALPLGLEHVGRALADRQVAREQPDGEGHEAHADGEPDDGGGERGPGAGAGDRGALPEQVPLDPLHLLHLAADRVHDLLALTAQHRLSRRLQGPAPVRLEREEIETATQDGQLLARELIEP
jgi:hypothetical protein